MTRTRRALAASALAIAAWVSAGRPVGAQQTPAPAASPEERLREEQLELQRIRNERAALEQRLLQIRGNVHTLGDEVSNLDNQAATTARAVRTLDRQLGEIGSQMMSSTGQLIQAEDQLAIQRAVLHRRMIELYKQGPLYTTEALLTARSLGGLIARYKYLHVIALHDRALVVRVEDLRDQIERQRHVLVDLHDAVVENRSEKATEESRLRQLEDERRASLVDAKRSQEDVADRLKRISASESHLGSLIASIETARHKAEARSNAPALTTSTIAEGDRGRLDWPVDGTILYRFGRVVNSNSTTTRWNGVGIQADMGTPVHAVAAGRVVVSRSIGTYGSTVIVQHGGGDYSVYGSLSRIDVKPGDAIERGSIIGTVGQGDPDLPPHLHFEIRRDEGQAVDPLDWLRAEPDGH